jgi:Zn-dependent peptidase ImmA (M78 family)
MFQPLRNVFGVYMPEVQGSRAGVLLNSNLPRSVQRFTAAHELGHHVLSHPPVTDLETDIYQPQSRTEQDADMFSERLIMPERLMRSALDRIGCPDGPASMQDVYQTSLEVGASYTATLRRLLRLQLINPRSAEQFFQMAPRTAKTELVAPSMVEDYRREAVLIKEEDGRDELYLRLGDVVAVELSEVPSTGYIWQVDLLGSGHEVQDEVVKGGDLYGGKVVRRCVFSLDGPGESELRMTLSRPWASRAEATRRNVRIHTEPAQLGPLRVLAR